MVRIPRFDDAFSEIRDLEPSKKVNSCSKKIRKGEKLGNERHKNAMLLKGRARCHAVNAFLCRLQLIWLLSMLKMSKLF